jgi:hypothetical protein
MQGRGWQTVVVGDHVVKEGLGHGNGLAGEIGVVVLAFAKLDTSGGIAVARQDREHVVLDGQMSD